MKYKVELIYEPKSWFADEYKSVGGAIKFVSEHFQHETAGVIKITNVEKEA